MKVLEINNVSKVIRKKQVLRDVSFFLCENEILGLIGRNGAGKSTAIKAILGLQKVNSGIIKINGYDIKNNVEKALNSVGAIVENPDMYSYLSGRDNLLLVSRMYKNITKEDIDKIIKLVKLEDSIDIKVSKYSLGMKQRLGIACSLINKPKLLILDEPTNGLDPLGIIELRNILLNLANEGIGILISSHNLKELENICNRVCFMDNGTIVKECSVDSNLEDIYLNVIGGYNEEFSN